MCKIFEREAFRIDLVRLRAEICFVQRFTSFYVSLLYEKTVNCDVVNRLILEVEIARNWFESIFVIFLCLLFFFLFLIHITIFMDAVCKFSPRFSFVDVFA